MIILYSTGCPKCCVLEKKLKDKNIDFIVNNDIEEMVRFGFKYLPMLVVDNKTLDFKQAVNWINGEE